MTRKVAVLEVLVPLRDGEDAQAQKNEIASLASRLGAALAKRNFFCVASLKEETMPDDGIQPVGDTKLAN